MDSINYTFYDFNSGDDATTNKISITRMEKDEVKEMRKARMSRCERFRERSAALLRGILLFGLPVLLSMVMLIVLVVIYIIRPYALTRDFTKTTCKVDGYKILNGSYFSCSAGTDPFEPCIRVEVTFPTGKSEETSVILENEEALVNCNPCSYTFGRHGLLHQYQDSCETWRENYNPEHCIDDFLKKYGSVGKSYSCYFNPNNPGQVIRDMILNLNLLIHTFSWPVLACLSYLLAWAFVSYDSKQLKLLDQCIMEEIAYHRRKQEIAKLRAESWKKRKLSHTLGIINHTENGLFRNSGICNLLGSFSNKQRTGSLPSLNTFSHNPEVTTPAHLAQTTENIQDLPFVIDDDDEEGEQFDLRHLDLAVSQQNINDLSASFPYLQTPSPVVFTGNKEAFGKSVPLMQGNSLRTLPTLSTFQTNTEHKYRRWNIVSNGTLPNGHYCKADSDDPLFAGTVPRKTVTNYDPVSKWIGPMHSPRSVMRSFYSGPAAADDENSEDGAVSEDEIDLYYTIANKQARKKKTCAEGEGIQIVNMFSANDESQV